MSVICVSAVKIYLCMWCTGAACTVQSVLSVLCVVCVCADVLSISVLCFVRCLTWQSQPLAVCGELQRIPC
jgi:hypothetical protein